MYGSLRLLSVVLLLLPLLSHAQCPGQAVSLQPFAKEIKVVSAISTTLTPSVFDQSAGKAAMASIQVKDASIAYDVVTTPTANDSQIAGVWSSFPICGLDSIRAFKAIRYGSTDARLIVYYYKSRQP
jgi:hypothetical protein